MHYAKLYFFVFSLFSLYSNFSIASDYDQALLRLTNIERTKQGLATLQLSPQLIQAAQHHAEDMAINNYFSHNALDGSSVGDRVERTGYQYMAVAENIGSGVQTPEQVVQKWMNSPIHRANILNPRLTEIGFGYATNPNSHYKRYWVQVFGTSNSSGNYSNISQPTQQAQTAGLRWETSQATAIQKALQHRKLILMVAGRDECGNTNSVRAQLENSTNDFRKMLQQKYVLWYSNVDSSEEHFQYTDGLGGRWTLPLVVIIDPRNPAQYIQRMTPMSTRSVNTSLYQWLKNYVE